MTVFLFGLGCWAVMVTFTLHEILWVHLPTARASRPLLKKSPLKPNYIPPKKMGIKRKAPTLNVKQPVQPER